MRVQAATRRSPHADWALIAAIGALVAERVIAGEATTLPELEDELVAMATGGEPRS